MAETYSQPQPVDGYRVPSHYTRCRRPHCSRPPAADLLRQWFMSKKGYWWAYCAEHLAEYNLELRDGVVWWRGTQSLETAATNG